MLGLCVPPPLDLCRLTEMESDHAEGPNHDSEKYLGCSVWVVLFIDGRVANIEFWIPPGTSSESLLPCCTCNGRHGVGLLF